MANAVLVTALVTAGVIHFFHRGNGDLNAAALHFFQSSIAFAIVCAIFAATLLALSPLARALLLFARTHPQATERPLSPRGREARVASSISFTLCARRLLP
eukprot:1004087-Pleurochrysis_carterae.AAC.1